MQTEFGVMTVVQEGRFQLRGDDGRTRLYILGHGATLEPQDLPGLLGAHLSVRGQAAVGRIAGVAEAICILARPAPLP